MKVSHNHSLKKVNSFGFNCVAEVFIEIESEEELHDYIASRDKARSLFVLGDGSNLVLMDCISGDVIKLNYGAIECVEQNDSFVLVRAEAGVHWDGFVEYCIGKHWYGLENLSWIPGTVGASPIQNIGAYGVELMDRCHSVTVFDLLNGERLCLPAAQCGFAYRDSYFKQQWRGQYVISDVTFKLSKQFTPCLSHQDLQKVLGQQECTAALVRQEVISIRNRKLPDPNKIGNAGSFFKNCIVDEETLTRLRDLSPDLPSYALDKQLFKVPTAWLVDSLGWKGKALGAAAVHSEQPLVLVNASNARGVDVLRLAKEIQRDVLSHYGLDLEIEPTIVGDT